MYSMFGISLADLHKWQSFKQDGRSVKSVFSTLKQDASTLMTMRQTSSTAVVAQKAVPWGCWAPSAESMHCRSVSRLWL